MMRSDAKAVVREGALLGCCSGTERYSFVKIPLQGLGAVMGL